MPVFIGFVIAAMVFGLLLQGIDYVFSHYGTYIFAIVVIVAAIYIAGKVMQWTRDREKREAKNSKIESDLKRAKTAIESQVANFTRLSKDRSLSQGHLATAEEKRAASAKLLSDLDSDTKAKPLLEGKSPAAGGSIIGMIALVGAIVFWAAILYLPTLAVIGFVTQEVLHIPGREVARWYYISPLVVYAVVGAIFMGVQEYKWSLERKGKRGRVLVASADEVMKQKREIEEEYEGWLKKQSDIAKAVNEASAKGATSTKEAISYLRRAKERLNAAEGEHKKRAFVAFWDLIEKAGDDIASASYWLSTFGKHLASYDTALKDYQGSEMVQPWPVRKSTITSLQKAGKELAQRLKDLSYKAQLNDRDFSMIYEMRRNTATLIDGFASLQEAIDRLGNRIERAIYDLESTVAWGFHDTGRKLDGIQDTIEGLAGTLDSGSRVTAKAMSDLNARIDEGYRELSKHGRFSREAMVQSLQSDYEMKVMIQDIMEGKKWTSSRYVSRLYGTILDPGFRPNDIIIDGQAVHKPALK